MLLLSIHLSLLRFEGLEIPNAPKTPTRTIRVPDDLWKAVQRKALSEGVTVTSVIINALETYLVDKK